MSALIVEGGNPLRGSAHVHGAKNSVLPILAAVLLGDGVSVLRNCPQLSDVAASAEILRHLGCTVEMSGDAICVDTAGLRCCDVPDELMREMRSSVIFLGAILGRMGCAELSFPGGCELGPRPIDLHLSALRALGAEIGERNGRLVCRGAYLKGADITLSLPSVGATENTMICACAAAGKTVIRNAAREPEIEDLAAFLTAMGAQISGAGTSTVVIQGGHRLTGAEHRVMGDRIVAATYLAAAAATGGEVSLTGVEPEHVQTVTELFRQAGCETDGQPGGVFLRAPSTLFSTAPVRTAPYPGFPTDAQAPVMAALCLSVGTTVFVENMFTNRYRHVPELSRMGADIRTEGRVAVVCGKSALFGARVEAHDLRGGAALVVAALAAKGKSEIKGIVHLDRGYENLVECMQGLGGQIHRR